MLTDREELEVVQTSNSTARDRTGRREREAGVALEKSAGEFRRFDVNTDMNVIAESVCHPIHSMHPFNSLSVPCMRYERGHKYLRPCWACCMMSPGHWQQVLVAHAIALASL